MFSGLDELLSVHEKMCAVLQFWVNAKFLSMSMLLDERVKNHEKTDMSSGCLMFFK